MRILVTGGAGYIGSHVVKQLLETTKHDVHIVDNLSGGHLETVETLQEIAAASGNGSLSFTELDLADFAAVAALLAGTEFDAVIHFAASLVVSESVTAPLKYYMNNTVNTIHLVSQCVQQGVGHFIFSSTAAVYGEPETLPIREENEKTPINPYGMSKRMVEQVLQDTAHAHPDFRYVILRYFNVAGADPKNRIGEMHEPETHLIPLVAKTALGKREKIMIFGDDYQTPDGTCIRDYVHVEDLASAHLKALEYTVDGGSNDAFNCGYGHGFSVREVIETVRHVSGNAFPVETAVRRDGDPAVLVSDNTKIRKVMGWEPQYDDLERICRSALEWERNNR